MTDQRKAIHAIVKKNIAMWRQVNDRVGEAPPWPADAPCYYCYLVEDYPQLEPCNYCIHNPDAEIFK